MTDFTPSLSVTLYDINYRALEFINGYISVASLVNSTTPDIIYRIMYMYANHVRGRHKREDSTQANHTHSHDVQKLQTISHVE